MKKTALVFSTFLLVLLCACSGMQTFENEEVDLRVSFPEDMHVFVAGEVKESDPALSEYEVDYKEFADFADESTQGGVFYAKSHDQNREYTISVLGNDSTIEVWEISQDNMTDLSDILNTVAESLNVSGYAVVEEKEYTRDGTCYAFFELKSSGAKQSNTYMLYTIKNGLQYTAMYKTEAPDENTRDEVDECFDHFFITKNIPKEGTSEEKSRVVQLVVIGVLALIVLVIVTMFLRLGKIKRKERDSQEYQSQFSNDTVGSNAKKKK